MDFYSGIVLRALGIPVSMYTVLFAVARTVGWVSQVRGSSEYTDAHVLQQRCYQHRLLINAVLTTVRPVQIF